MAEYKSSDIKPVTFGQTPNDKQPSVYPEVTNTDQFYFDHQIPNQIASAESTKDKPKEVAKKLKK